MTAIPVRARQAVFIVDKKAYSRNSINLWWKRVKNMTWRPDNADTKTFYRSELFSNKRSVLKEQRHA